MDETTWWLAYETKREVLEEFVRRWHPASQHYDPRGVRVTAPDPEEACRQVRVDLQRAATGDPHALLVACAERRDARGVCALLSGAWFGVPEGADALKIPGFHLACTLMDDEPGSDTRA